jgi:hypothetical protein
MAYALVGTIGAATQGAASTSVTPAWGTSENRTAGNLLICFCSVTQISTFATPPSGWSQVQGGAGTLVSTTIFYKIAAGADAAPTIPLIGAGVISAQLAEFSGNSATPLDKTGSATATSSPITATFGSADTASGELIVMAGGDTRSLARSPNDTWTSNHATVTQAGSNNGVSSTDHYSFGYALATTSNAGANTAVMTCSVTTSLTGLSIATATFLLPPPPVNVLPELITQPITPARRR